MDTSDIKKNLKIMMDGAPYTVVDFQFVKPGKGQAFTRCKIKNLATGAVLERTWKSGEKLEPADVEERKMTYIYPEGDKYVFMDGQSGEQIYVNKDLIGDEAQFLMDGLAVDVMLWNGNAIGVELPAHVVVQITASEPGVKGDTASNVTKPATIATGATVNVPLFVKEGEWIKIDTRTGEYLERVNKLPDRLCGPGGSWEKRRSSRLLRAFVVSNDAAHRGSRPGFSPRMLSRFSGPPVDCALHAARPRSFPSPLARVSGGGTPAPSRWAVRLSRADGAAGARGRLRRAGALHGRSRRRVRREFRDRAAAGRRPTRGDRGRGPDRARRDVGVGDSGLRAGCGIRQVP
jgi:elongation factor P